jgi:hypothetical protein
MTQVFTALATSVDGYITGPEPGPERPLGEGGAQLFAWYADGNTASSEFPDFRLDEASAPVFDAIAARTGAVVAGRRTYDHSHGWGRERSTSDRTCLRAHALAGAVLRRRGSVVCDIGHRRGHRAGEGSGGRQGRGPDGVAHGVRGTPGEPAGRGDRAPGPGPARGRGPVVPDAGRGRAAGTSRGGRGTRGNPSHVPGTEVSRRDLDRLDGKVVPVVGGGYRSMRTTSEGRP